MAVELGPFSLDRVVRAVEQVRLRLLKVTAALDGAAIPYAVAGGNEVALWVSRVDEAAVRNTRDVDLLVRREDLEAIKGVFANIGFVCRHSSGLDMYLDGVGGKERDVVHLAFAEEKVWPDETLANPAVTESEHGGEFQVMALRALVQIKLTAYRDKDRTHLRDLLEVGLIDASWTQRYPPELAERLQALIDTPNG